VSFAPQTSAPLLSLAQHKWTHGAVHNKVVEKGLQAVPPQESEAGAVSLQFDVIDASLKKEFIKSPIPEAPAALPVVVEPPVPLPVVDVPPVLPLPVESSSSPPQAGRQLITKAIAPILLYDTSLLNNIFFSIVKIHKYCTNIERKRIHFNSCRISSFWITLFHTGFHCSNE